MLGRRRWLMQTACGFGGLASGAMLARAAQANNQPHFAPKAKRIIFLFMQGGVSHVDSFDYKPMLAKRDGEMLPFEDDRVLAKTGQRNSTHRVMRSPWAFKQYGQTGRWVSDLFPHMAQHVDQMCMVHSMHTEGVAHGPSTLFLHCGSTNFVRPSFGSWVSYGLGSENEDLPAFVSIAPSVGNGGPRNYGSAFLPAKYQGTAIGTASTVASNLQIENLAAEGGPWGGSRDAQRRQLDFIQSLNREQLARRARSGGAESHELEAVLESYELGWRMQTAAPEVFDLQRESALTRTAYGLDNPTTRGFGEKCLLARRLCESGVRFVQVNYGDNSANPAWDQHSNLPKHADHAKAVDQPIGALMADLKARGLLEDTLVWWGGEFGRTPYSQSNGTGRDHNPSGFTVWLAGGGVAAGRSVGKTDEFGHSAIENKIHMHDLHATLLHMMGIDHERLTYEYAGRHFRLTDVHGRVVNDLIA
ncbi:MAG: DUF1501 domain-containing protein [Pirellulaceae bacterium]|nr:DUF1501 domain-containing protein [Pirellulaceae bacterium]